MTRQLFYHLCQFSYLLSEHQLVVSTFVELIKYSQLVQFLVYILRLNWILLQDNDTCFSLIYWHHVNDAHHLLLMIRMKREHHVNDVLLSKEIDVNFNSSNLSKIKMMLFKYSKECSLIKDFSLIDCLKHNVNYFLT